MGNKGIIGSLLCSLLLLQITPEYAASTQINQNMIVNNTAKSHET
jgi:hypothetical protein